ncbi:MAG: hypothetical protein OXE84_13605, partial [Rhodobacteraceae bacterium]|nr:hypothetical protein [Paracoccaceae bacterium]
QISAATVGQMIADRVARQPIAPVSAVTPDSKTKRRTRRPDAVRISGALKARAPGDAVQVDTLTAALCPGRTVQHVTAIDRHSRWGSARATTLTERNPLIDTHLDLTNGWRPHDARDDQTPNEYRESLRIAANP